MAFTLSLVSFSCTGPIIGFLLVQVSTTGSVVAPAIGMLGFAIALALPFTLFLPRAVIRKQDTPFVKEWKRRFGKEPSYHTVHGAESIFAIAKALKKDGGYAPQKLVESLREIRKQRLNDPETAASFCLYGQLGILLQTDLPGEERISRIRAFLLEFLQLGQKKR